MDINNINNYTRIISYNDDNHGIRIYVNGNFIDDMGLRQLDKRLILNYLL